MRRYCALAIVLVLVTSCASVAHYDQIDTEVYRGDFPAAFARIQDVRDTAYQPNDRVLFFLDAGLLAYYSGNYTEASRLFGEAERAIEAAFTKSISLEVSTYLVNDIVQEYPGEDYEDIYLNVFNALSYYHNGSTEGALVEVRRIDNKLKFLSTKYGQVITNAQQAVLAKSSDVPFDPNAVQSQFVNSALARYLSMLLFRSNGQRDSARVDRDQIRLAFANQPALYPFPLPGSIDHELTVPQGQARLNVIGFYGPSPIKVEEASRVMLGSGNWLKFAFPVMVQRPSRIDRVEVVLDSGESFNLELIEDLGLVAMDTFARRSAFIYLKTVLRSITKTASSAALRKGSDKAQSAETALLLGLLSIGTQIYAEASEQADLRLSRYFPARAVVGGITLAPGTYSYTVRFLDGGGRLVSEIRHENIELRPNRLNLSEAICIQ